MGTGLNRKHARNCRYLLFVVGGAAVVKELRIPRPVGDVWSLTHDKIQ